MWEAKVVAAAEAEAEADEDAAADAAVDAAETNWKHKVTPDRGDLKRCDRQTDRRTDGNKCS